MSQPKFVDVALGDVVRLRKDHPCGGADFEVVRLGADIGLRCLTCQHRILLPRSQFERRLKGFLSRSRPPEPEMEPAAAAPGGTDEVRPG